MRISEPLHLPHSRRPAPALDPAACAS